MGIELNGTFEPNEDGSIDLPTGQDGSKSRWVEEKHLLAFKGSAQEKEKEWNTKETDYQSKLAEANRLKDETHQKYLNEQAEKEKLTETYKDYDTHKSRVGELEKEVGSHKESVGNYEKELAGRIRANLISHGATEEQLKDKAIDQLRNLEEAATLFGKGGQPANYDGGKSGSGSHPLEFTRPVAAASRAYQDKGWDKKI